MPPRVNGIGMRAFHSNHPKVRCCRRTVILAAALAAAPIASAQLVSYDLRFSDGDHVKQAVIGTYSLELWMRVSGTDTNHANDSLSNSYVVLQSTQTAGGGITAGGLSG